MFYLFKFPFQVLVWKNINWTTLFADILLVPALALGFWGGMYIVRSIKEAHYRKLVLLLTLLGCIVMLLRR